MKTSSKKNRNKKKSKDENGGKRKGQPERPCMYNVQC